MNAQETIWDDGGGGTLFGARELLAVPEEEVGTINESAGVKIAIAPVRVRAELVGIPTDEVLSINMAVQIDVSDQVGSPEGKFRAPA